MARAPVGGEQRAVGQPPFLPKVDSPRGVGAEHDEDRRLRVSERHADLRTREPRWCVDWLCFPRFDSGACFAALLGDGEERALVFSPGEEVTATRRRYRGDTLILETEIETASGMVRLDRLHAAARKGAGHCPHRGRRARERGDADGTDRSALITDTSCRGCGSADGALEAIAGPDALVLRTPIETHGENMHTVAEFTVKEGERVPFVLTWFPSHEKAPPESQSRTRAGGDGKLLDGVVGELPDAGPVARGGGAFAHHSEGADLCADRRHRGGGHDFVAGGNRRRAQLGLPLLLAARCDVHASGVDGRRLSRRSARLARVAFARGRRQPGADANHVRRVRRAPADGIRNAVAVPATKTRSPVRVGNAASSQFQLDVYGEVLDSMYRAHCAGIKTSEDGLAAAGGVDAARWNRNGRSRITAFGKCAASRSISRTRK